MELSNASMQNDLASVHAFDAQTVSELLEDGFYKEVADILTTACREYKISGNAVPAELLSAVRQLCVQCHQSRVEAEWHQWAKDEAIRRERALKHHIAAILEYIAAADASLVQQPRSLISLADEGSGNLLNPPPKKLWGRVQNWLGLSSRPDMADSEASASATPSPVAPPFSPNPLAPATDTDPLDIQPMTPTLAVYCLGAFRIYHNDKPISKWNGNKSQMLLKYLVAHRGKQIPKDVLMDLLWPEMDPDAARRNLHQAIYCLRQTLRQHDSNFNHILFENDCYFLNPGMKVWVDADEFESHAKLGLHLEAAGQVDEAVVHYGIAENLYQGDFLEEDPYEEWTNPIRNRLRALYLEVADRLSEHYARVGEYAVAINLCHRILERDNCHEGAHRRLMCCYLAQGQRHMAVRQYQICQEALRNELNISPSPETQAIAQSI